MRNGLGRHDSGHTYDGDIWMVTAGNENVQHLAAGMLDMD